AVVGALASWKWSSVAFMVRRWLRRTQFAPGATLPFPCCRLDPILSIVRSRGSRDNPPAADPARRGAPNLTPQPPSLRGKGEPEVFSPFPLREGGWGVRFFHPAPVAPPLRPAKPLPPPPVHWPPGWCLSPPRPAR